MIAVSVIIAAYNAEKYIKETIDSVLAQSYPSVECIIVDDGSTDNTRQILNNYHDRIQYIYQENAERCVARNNGIAHASGKYITFLDADDYITADKIADQAAYLENNPGYDVVYSGVRYFKDNGKRSFYTVDRPTPEGDILDNLIYGNFINLSSPLIRKDAVDRIGGFDGERKEIILNEDWDFWLRLAISGARFGFIDKYHLFYRVHGENTSKDRILMCRDKLRVAEKIIHDYSDILLKKNIDSQQVLQRIRAEYGMRLILEGRVPEGRTLIAEACKTDIPHRTYLQFFSLFAKLFGHRLLAARYRGIKDL